MNRERQRTECDRCFRRIDLTLSHSGQVAVEFRDGEQKLKI